MATFHVTVTNTVSTTIAVEADSADEAADKVHESDRMPGGMTVGAWGYNSEHVDSGDWVVATVADDKGTVVLDESEVG